MAGIYMISAQKPTAVNQSALGMDLLTKSLTLFDLCLFRINLTTTTTKTTKRSCDIWDGIKLANCQEHIAGNLQSHRRGLEIRKANNNMGYHWVSQNNTTKSNVTKTILSDLMSNLTNVQHSFNSCWKHEKKDLILIVTAKLDIMVLACEVNTNSSHSYDIITRVHGNLKDTVSRPAQMHYICSVDPTSSLIAVKCYDAVLKLIPITADSKQLNVTTTR